MQWISYEAEHLDEVSNSKSKKAIAFKANLDDAGEQTSSQGKDNNVDMALLTKRFKSFGRKGFFKGKRQMKFSEDRKTFKSKEEVNGKDIVCYECRKLGHIKPGCSSLKK